MCSSRKELLPGHLSRLALQILFDTIISLIYEKKSPNILAIFVIHHCLFASELTTPENETYLFISALFFLFFFIYSDHSQQCYILPCLSCTSVYNAVRTILIGRTASVALFFSLHMIHLQVLCCRPSIYLHEFYIE